MSGGDPKASARPPAERTRGALARRVAARLVTPAAVLACTVALAWVQFSFEGLYDGDSYFHTRAARELDREGVRETFPQAAFSTWRESYSDKDFLFHALLIPFQRVHLGAPEGPAASPSSGAEDLVTPGKQAVVFLDVLVLGSLALALRLCGARFGVLFVLLLFSTQLGFLRHMLSVRPHLLAIALTLLEVALLSRRSVLPLAALACVHVLTHSSFVLLPIFTAAVAAAYLLRGEPLPWRPAAAVVAGLAAGLLLHPYFPNHFALFWDQTVEVAGNVWSTAPPIPPDLFGAELRPLTTDILLLCFPGWVPAALALLAFLAWSGTARLSTPGLALVIVGAVLFVLQALSGRFLDLFLPVATLVAGRLWTELAAGCSLRDLWRDVRRDLLLAGGALAAVLAAGVALYHPGRLRGALPEEATYEVYRPAVEFLRREAAPDELVYHCFWWDFSILYHYRPDGRYVGALDPVYLYGAGPERFAEMLQIFRGRVADVGRALEEGFGARWLFLPLERRYQPLRRLAAADPALRRAYADRHAEVYEVR